MVLAAVKTKIRVAIGNIFSYGVNKTKATKRSRKLDL
jgi:hypothetical protein